MADVSPAVPSLILVTGPARSGKSEWAEYLAVQSGRAVTYVATAAVDPHDDDWQARIAAHRRRRPATWQTREVPQNLAAAVADARPEDCWLVDSLGTWLANCLEQSEQDWLQTQQALLIALQQRSAQIILVAEETGWGVVPAYPLGRTFRDRLGGLIRQIGTLADQAYLVAAGHAVDLRRWGTPVPSVAAPNIAEY